MKPQSLFEILEQYLITPPEDSQVVERFKALLINAEAPFSRNQYPGHLTASCFVVNPSRSSILLLHHRKLKKWLQMGGHCESEVSLEAVALREAQEETGSSSIRLIDSRAIDLDIHWIPALKGEPAHEHFDVRFLGVCEAPENLQRSEEETTDLQWFSWEEAFRIAQEKSMHRVFKKIRENTAY